MTMRIRESTGDAGRVTSWGSGPEVVFLSNPLADPRWWTEPVRSSLVAAGFTVTALEHEASSPDWRTVVDAVGTFVRGRGAPVSLVGWSLGATIAQEVTLALPEYVSCAALLAPYGRQSEIDRVLQQCWQVLGEDSDALDPVRLALGLLTAFPATKLADDEFVAHMRRIQPQWSGRAHPTKRRLAAEYIAGYQDRLTAISQISRPCLVMGFELDTDTFAARAREVAEAIPNAQYVELADTGHVAPVSHPDDVWPVVMDFLRRHSSALSVRVLAGDSTPPEDR